MAGGLWDPEIFFCNWEEFLQRRQGCLTTQKLGGLRLRRPAPWTAPTEGKLAGGFVSATVLEIAVHLPPRATPGGREEDAQPWPGAGGLGGGGARTGMFAGLFTKKRKKGKNRRRDCRISYFGPPGRLAENRGCMNCGEGIDRDGPSYDAVGMAAGIKLHKV